MMLSESAGKLSVDTIIEPPSGYVATNETRHHKDCLDAEVLSVGCVDVELSGGEDQVPDQEAKEVAGDNVCCGLVDALQSGLSTSILSCVSRCRGVHRSTSLVLKS